jgi:RHS repeat-associated protein
VPDQLNTPRLIADQTGNTVWRWDQGEPFGNDVPNNNPLGLGAFEFNPRFPGQYFDRETNLNYNYFRDYDPGIGRYAESDPIGLFGGLNTYLYAQASPLLLVDMRGLLGLFPEIPKKPIDTITPSPTKLFGKEQGMVCAKQCTRLKNPRSTPGLAAIEICNELMPWLQGHLRGGDVLDACVNTCVSQYPKICNPPVACVGGQNGTIL